MRLQTRFKLENHNQRAKHSTHPSHNGQRAHSQLMSITSRSFIATKGIEHKIDIPMLGPTKIGLEFLFFIAILRKVMDLD